MQNIMARFIKDEDGATAIEYGLLAALIGVAIVVGASQIGQQLNAGFNNVSDVIDTNMGG